MQAPIPLRRIVLALAPALPALAIGLLLWELRLDDSFITYRYAHNLARGLGFVYNPGEPVLSTTNPLYTLLLAGLARVLPFELPMIGQALGVAGIAAGAALLALLLRPAYGTGSALCAGLLYVSFPLLWLAMGLETPLQLALGLAAIFLYLNDRTAAAAFLVGLATLTRPDMLVLAGVLAVHSWWLRRRPPLAEGAVLATALLPWIVYATITFGSALPATLGAKAAQDALGITGFSVGTGFMGGLWLVGRALMAQSWAWLGVAAIAVIGIAALIRQPSVHQAALIMLAWGVLHVAAYLALGIAPYRWYYAPLVPGLAALFALGTGRGRILTALLILMAAATGSLLAIDRGMQDGERTYHPAATPMLATIDWDIYQEAGEWLAARTPEGAVIGVAEVGQIGYYARRPMVDYLGLLQPPVTDAVARGDIYWWLPHYLPDYLALSQPDREPALFGYSLADDAWFHAFYSEQHRVVDTRYLRSPLVIYQRQRDPLPLTRLSDTTISFPDELLVTGVQADLAMQTLRPGSPLRVQSAWEAGIPLIAARQVAIRLLSWDGSAGAQSDHLFRADLWPVGEPFTLYHTLLLSEELTPGLYTLEIGVGDEGGGMVWLPAARLKAPLPAPDLADLRHGGVVLGELTVLGYRLRQTGDRRLEVGIGWEASRPPAADYTLFLHLLDTDGQIVAQVDAPPGGPGYPSGLWSVGEPVRGDFTLPLADLRPGRYRLVAGLYTADGGRLRTPDGADVIPLGEVRLGEATR